MIENILTTIGLWITSLISSTGYSGVFFLMAIESACVPAPSEVIMPFSGFLVYIGEFNIHIVSFAGAFGNLSGSLLAWWIGARGGRPLIEKYGRYILISKHDIDLADHFFQRYGKATVFFSRLLPVVRTYISFPAGIAKMPILPFSLYTFLGALPWCYFLTWIGILMGERWDVLRVYFRQFDVAIGIIILGGLVWYVWRHIRSSRVAESEADR